MKHEPSNFIMHIPCPYCGSRNNGSLYDNGTAHCFGCKENWRVDGEALESRPQQRTEFEPIKGHTQSLEKRRIKEDTCVLWRYELGEYAGQPCQIANYRDAGGKLVAQKLRFKDKSFKVLGNGKKMPLYGQWLWHGGKSVTITEGEIDALTVSQVFGNKYAVVSLPHGAQSAKEALLQAYEWLDSFESIVLMFDMDDPGREAAEDAASVLPVGKVKIANLPAKDANATLLEHGPQYVTQAFWNAQEWRPDGIISGEEMTVEKLKAAVEKGFTLPYPKMQAMTYGLRKREITMLAAGTGSGKSTLAREWAYYLHEEHGLRIGNVFLEESNAKTAQAYIAIHNNVPLGKLRANPDLLTDAQWQTGLDEVVKDRMWFYDHFGSLDSVTLLLRMRYLATVKKVDFIILDHISIVISGSESSSEGERRDIDKLMTRLRSLAEETGVGIIAIVHLNQPEGTPHEEGGRVTLRNLRGSGALKQLSDNVYALERDQQGEDVLEALVRVLKCRETGETGEADTLEYNRETGRLLLKPVESAF